jgi:preprotein translocase subunit YajC
LKWAVFTPHKTHQRGLSSLNVKDNVREIEMGRRYLPNDKRINPMFASPAYAQAVGGASGITSFIPLILIFAIMYFLMIRPQQKKVKEHRAMVEALRKGDRVVTAGGIMGKVTKVGADNEVEVEIATGVKVKVVQHTIQTVINKTEPAK